MRKIFALTVLLFALSLNYCFASHSVDNLSSDKALKKLKKGNCEDSENEILNGELLS